MKKIMMMSCLVLALTACGRQHHQKPCDGCGCAKYSQSCQCNQKEASGCTRLRHDILLHHRGADIIKTVMETDLCNRGT